MGSATGQVTGPTRAPPFAAVQLCSPGSGLAMPHLLPLAGMRIMRASWALVLAACLLLPGTWAQRRQQLTDDTFEHITQASTGQTTGVWLVNFCSPKACKDLAPAWEELGKDLLQQQLFVTSVDVHSNPQLRTRFGITTLPTILLFRDRKVGLGWAAASGVLS